MAVPNANSTPNVPRFTVVATGPSGLDAAEVEVACHQSRKFA